MTVDQVRFDDEGAGLAAAVELARRVHDGQTDKCGVPYIEHCERVALKLDGDEAKTVAFLHDVLEDTATTEDELRDRFPGRVVDAVVAITHMDSEPREDFYRRVRSDPLALRVKLADIHDNLEPSRMAALDETTRRRLLRKYGKALVALSE